MKTVFVEVLMEWIALPIFYFISTFFFIQGHNFAIEELIPVLHTKNCSSLFFKINECLFCISIPIFLITEVAFLKTNI